jgi:subtilisin family serine protease
MKKPVLRLCVATAVLATAALALASSAFAQNYIMLYKQNAVAPDVGATVKQAGGSVIATYPQIGVVIARSSSPSFGTSVLKDSRIDSAASTRGVGVKLKEPTVAPRGPLPGGFPNSPATDSDNLSGLQWDMAQIHTPEAHAITGGSRSVLVGDIDSGMDFEHPDLAPNYDAANSTDCSSGAPATLPPDNDLLGHGTHTAGIIAAASNGVGIVGVAPNVRIAAIKAISPDFFLFPEMIVCAFMWAGTHHMDVTNNSYFADPWEYNCKNDPEQRAIWKAEQRAIKYAQQQGVTVVAAEGNDSDDTAHPSTDVTSPDSPPGSAVEREITNACVIIPVEISGVIGVSATGSTTQDTSAGQYPDNLKSFYSSFGVGVTDVTAPGGDSVFQNTGDPVGRGRVLSTYPANFPCSRSRQEPFPSDPTYPTAFYCYLQGTSMASPHAAGVAALIISRYGDSKTPQNGKMRPSQVAAYMQQSADPQDCPSTLPAGYLAFTGVNSGAVQHCQGGPGNNSWYGSGQVDALNAVTKASGNQ